MSLDLFTQRILPMKDRLFRFAFRLLRNVQEAEDILQDGFIRAFRYMKDYRSEGSLEGWLRRIMVTTALNFLKSQKHFREEQDVADVADQSDEEVNALQRMETAELVQLIQQLSPGYRTVLNLFAVEGYSHKEIGELLGIGESTSRSQYTRARQLLQKKIEEHNSFGIKHERQTHGK